jgi:hypothetical protein
MSIDPIKYPGSLKEFPQGDITVTGTYSDKAPPGWRFALFTRRDNTYWPKGRFTDNQNGTWGCVLTEPNKGKTQIVATQVADGVYLWINFYGYVGKTYKEWVGQQLDPMPESIRVDDIATIEIGS